MTSRGPARPSQRDPGEGYRSLAEGAKVSNEPEAADKAPEGHERAAGIAISGWHEHMTRELAAYTIARPDGHADRRCQAMPSHGARPYVLGTSDKGR